MGMGRKIDNQFSCPFMKYHAVYVYMYWVYYKE